MTDHTTEIHEPPSKELQTAIAAAKAGADKVLHHYHQGIASQLKADKTVVTQADHDSEAVIKSVIQESFPDALFLAEESGGSQGEANLWIIDPIDGTRSFQRGIPTWDILVSYQEDGEMKLGVSYFPILDMLIYAERGKGAFLNGQLISVSPTPTLSESLIGFGSQRHFANKQVLIDVIEASGSVRSPDTMFTVAMIAKGSVDGVVDAYAMPWDFAPYKVILEEAGGKITKLNGEPWRIDDSKGGVISNGHIHDELLEITGRYYS